MIGLRQHIANSRLMRRLFSSGYNAGESMNRRAGVQVSWKSEDRELRPQDRQRGVSGGRDAQRQFSVAAWAIRKHLDYVSSFKYKANILDASGQPDQQANDDFEAMVAEWSRKENCDIAGRHSLDRLIRISENRRVVDGDVFFLKLASGHIQVVEGDRVRDPSDGDVTSLNGDDTKRRWVQGVEIDANGRALRYAVHNRTAGRPQFDRVLQARNVIPMGYYDRVDQIRGVSPLTPAINTLRDLYESFDYALAKAKISQLFGLAMYRNSGVATGLMAGTKPTAESTGNNDPSQVSVRFNGTPVQGLDLNADDRVEWLESPTPSSEFQAYSTLMVQVALKAVDLPYSFFNESFTNFSGSRQAWIQYEHSTQPKRASVKETLTDLVEWRTGAWMRRGLWSLPRGYTQKHIWLHTGVPWIDPLKEIQAQVLAINNGILSRQQVALQQGKDWIDTVNQLEYENQVMADKGLPVYLPTERGAQYGPLEADNDITANT